MNERQWELYRLSVVETWAESPYKRAVSAADLSSVTWSTCLKVTTASFSTTCGIGPARAAASTAQYFSVIAAPVLTAHDAN
jgi:hypothetical protein